MPGVSRTQRAEAKYNVTLDFPNLGLHPAAASGNLGLVTYALDHGQPINSVLDGVLPLHVACSGGNDLIVRLLIERGADVNAPRLPRRYSSEKHRDTSAPIVGGSGSTPLHFAAANGHANVVLTLLLHGAHPDRADKHGVTPEMLARQNGWIACADILSQWSHNKDKDLRDRDTFTPSNPDSDATSAVQKPEWHECRVVDKKLRVKRSIDNALHMLRPALTQTTSALSQADDATTLDESFPTSPQPMITATSESPPETFSIEEFPPRRPSLPHLFEEPRSHTFHSKQSRHVGSSSRRPRSAGTDAEPPSTPQKVRGKISLLNMFKKGGHDSAGNPATPESFSSYASSSSAFTSASGSPAPDQRSTLLVPSPSKTHSSDRLSPTSPEPSSITTVPPSRLRGRVFSEGTPSTPDEAERPPLAVELHRALSNERLQGGTSLGGDTKASSLHSSRSPSMRPGILRPHGRSASSGIPHTENHRTSSPSVRALRFDSSSTTASTSPRRGGLNASGSISSLRGEVPSAGPKSPLRGKTELEQLGEGQDLRSQPMQEEDYDQHPEDKQDEEEGYGEPISPEIGAVPLELPSGALKPVGRLRRESNISSQSSSPIPSPSIPLISGFDCPFSINRLPPEEAAPSTTSSNLLGIHGIDNRVRGDSISSMSTDISTNPALSSSDTSALVATPALPQYQLPVPFITSPDSMSSDFVNPIEVTFIPIDKGEDQHSSKSFIQDVETPLPPKGARTPLDIDIRSISSHAQAEALVQRAQQSILDMQHNGVTVASVKNSLGSDRTPLSAKLAAYGESLAIERKFKEEEERMKSPSSATSHLAEDLAALRGYPHVHLSHSPRDLDRKFSLEERRPEARSHMKTKIKRPHTSGGISVSADASQSILRSVSPTRSHKQSISGGILADAIPTSIDPDKFNTALGASITPPRTLRLTEEPASIALPPPRIVRSRTPDPVSDMLNVPSLNGGSPLSRVSTAPLQDIMSERGMSEQERQVARANKLAKMGLSSYDSWPHAPYGHVRGSSSKHLFGGIKTFVQTLTGKS